MPNWCSSTINITGPKEEIQSVADTNLDFEKILATPADLIPDTYDEIGMTEFAKQSNLATYGYEDWYWWCVNNWGTKWSANNVVLEMLNDTTLQVTMDTAWALPLEILKKISADHPNCTLCIDCEEESGSFVGDCTILGGVVIEDNIHEPTREEMIQRGMIDEDDN